MTNRNLQISFERSGKVLAILAGAAASGEATSAAADLAYISPEFTSDNVVGWLDGALELSSFAMTVTGGRTFHAIAQTNGSQLRVLVTRYDLNATTFRIAIDSSARGYADALQLMAIGQTIQAAAGYSNFGLAGILIDNSGLQPPGQMAVDPGEQAYFLFQFEDNGTIYDGWIDVDIRVAGSTPGPLQNYVRINRYAWQSSTLGNLAAGSTPVPEPSTMVTAAIAALAGGAVALRKWRKERKTTTDAA